MRLINYSRRASFDSSLDPSNNDDVTSNRFSSSREQTNMDSGDILRRFVNHNTSNESPNSSDSRQSSYHSCSSGKSALLQDDVTDSNAMGDNLRHLKRETVHGYSAEWLPDVMKEAEIFYVDQRQKGPKNRFTVSFFIRF